MTDAARTETPLVSIVTSVYNRLRYGETSLRSLLDQNYHNFEVIAVDDGSTDGSGAWLDSVDDPRLKVLHQQNQGNGMGLNAGIAAARGALIAIHDFGDICHPERIARQAAVLASRPEIGLVSCWVSRRDVATGDRTYLRHRKTRPFAEAILKETPFTHGEVMYRKELWEKAGRYRREFRYAVDRDLFVRMSRLCDYHVIEEDLYEQLLFPDGISTVPEKLILQAYFAELANECGERVLRGESDLVDAYGAAAGFFLRPSRRVADRLARNGLKPLSLGQREAAFKLIDAGRREKATPLTMAIMLAYRAIYHSERTERLLLPLLRRARDRWTRRKLGADR
jgi:glycosyltransferase involved in cell wall biosynthesis